MARVAAAFLVLALCHGPGVAVDPRNFSDATLPGFHFVAYPFDWMNDPNGPVYDPVHSMYHLFYQYKTPREWGHAASRDLVNWVQLPVALSCEESYDANGDFSGSATVLDDEDKTILLSVSTPESAFFFAVPTNRSDPYLKDWSYAASEPFYTSPVMARDPTELWRGPEGQWQLAFGTENGTALLQSQPGSPSPLDPGNVWESPSMIQDNTLLPGNTADERFWECPDVFSLPAPPKDAGASVDDVWVSKFSKIGPDGDWYYLGQYLPSDSKFIPSSNFPRGVYDQNPDFYASKSFFDTKQSRRVLWGWLKMNDWPSDDVVYNNSVPAEWQNAQSLPRVLSLVPSGTDSSGDGESSMQLTSYPIPELEVLRGTELLQDMDIVLRTDGLAHLLDVTGRMLDIEADVVASAPGVQCGFQVLRSQDGETFVEALTTPATRAGQASSLRILVDASVVETFQDSGLTSRTQFLTTGAGNGVAIVSGPPAPSGLARSSASTSQSHHCSFTGVRIWPMSPFNFDTSLVS